MKRDTIVCYDYIKWTYVKEVTLDTAVKCLFLFQVCKYYLLHYIPSVHTPRHCRGVCGQLTRITLCSGHRHEPVTTLRPSRCQERAWWPMRSGQRIVSDEEEQVIGVPTAQVTSNMPVLGPNVDSTSLRGLLIAIFILLSLPRCRCTDLGKSNSNSHTRHTPKFYDFRKVLTLFWPLSTSVTLFTIFSIVPERTVVARSQEVAIENLIRSNPVETTTRSFSELKCL